MWPMINCDPTASRRSPAHGASFGRVRWTWKGRDRGWLSKPLVAADGRIVVTTTGPTWKESTLVVLTPDGRVERTIDSGGKGWGQPVIRPDGSIVVPNGRALGVVPPGSSDLERVEFPFEFRSLRATPSGDLLACIDGTLFAWLDPQLHLRWKKSLDIAGFVIDPYFAFDEAGTIYVGASGVWRSDEDDPEYFSGFGAMDASGAELWKIDFMGHTRYDTPVLTPEYVWGQNRGAVVFGQEEARCYDAKGRAAWEISYREMGLTPANWAPYEVFKHERLRGAPLLVFPERKSSRLVPVSIDADGRIAVIIDNELTSLNPDLSTRWSLPLDERLAIETVVGPAETLLVAGSSQLVAVE
jgi:hypothetical protein